MHKRFSKLAPYDLIQNMKKLQSFDRAINHTDYILKIFRFVIVVQKSRKEKEEIASLNWESAFFKMSVNFSPGQLPGYWKKSSVTS